jgi:hypothetical protein
MTTHRDHPPQGEIRVRKEDLCVWARLTGPLPLTWDEVERALPALSRGEAALYLEGRLQDVGKAVLYKVLLACQPGLRAALRPEPAGTLIVMRLEDRLPRKGTTFRAAAKALGEGVEGGDGETVLTSEEGYRLRAFPHPRRGRTSLELSAPVEHGPVALYKDGSPLQLLEPFDQFGYAVVRTRHIDSVLRGRAILELVVG